MKKLLLTGIAALFLATGTAHAMQADISKTWCGRQAAKFTGDRQHYYEFIEKCHRRRGTKPCWGVPGGTICERRGTEDELLFEKWFRFYQQQKRTETVPLPRRDPRQ